MKRIVTSRIGMVQGSRVLFSDFVNGGAMWTGHGARESRHVISFAEAFDGKPVVHVSISLWDIDQQTNVRADISAEHVTSKDFHLIFRTWGDTRIARIRADWLAIGPVRDDDDWEVE